MQPKIENIGDYLKKNNIKPSFQRLKVYEYLIQKCAHPTVDEIYRELVPTIPTLSKTTVYNTLKLFMDKGIVRSVLIEENELRYDVNMTTHGHFKCDLCGKIMDFDSDILNVDSPILAGCQIKQRHLFFTGICEECKKN